MKNQSGQAKTDAKDKKGQLPALDNTEQARGIRLNKFIAAAGYCSRRQADRLIEQKQVFLNDKVAELGARVFPQDKVVIDNQIIKAQEEADLVYLAFNKPQGIVCTANPEVEDNIIDFINYPQRIFTIGRLDKDSEGLILLTNDGSIFNKIVRAEYENEKEYLVEVDHPFDADFIHAMQSGVKILDTLTNPTKVQPITRKKFKLTLTQGLNRQIRRMCEALGYKVVFLQRIRIMNITLGSLPLGTYRELSDKELRDLFALLP
ncbi:MAG: pseudouridine synthase [Saccharofermentanales bacterium]|jgi:23S rRNA pseudouridine2604 synthase